MAAVPFVQLKSCVKHKRPKHVHAELLWGVKSGWGPDLPPPHLFAPFDNTRVLQGILTSEAQSLKPILKDL